jgi:hypothetical protein
VLRKHGIEIEIDLLFEWVLSDCNPPFQLRLSQKCSDLFRSVLATKNCSAQEQRYGRRCG